MKLEVMDTKKIMQKQEGSFYSRLSFCSAYVKG